MTQKDLYKQYIKNNIPLLLLGESGTGKSEIIKSIADELKMPLIDLRMSQLPPEDLNGLPAPSQDGKSFGYLMPSWFGNFQPDTPFILFLDEINQASPATINALYAIVHDKMVAGRYNPQMRVVGAGNLMSESDYISELPQPLLNRFVVKQHKINKKEVVKYLTKKYEGNDLAQRIIKAIESCDWAKTMNPRAFERIIKQLSVYKIVDMDEVKEQAKSDSLATIIQDTLKGEIVEHIEESATAEIINRARNGETDAELPAEIQELLND